MIRTVLSISVAAALAVAAPAAHAGIIETACIRSERPAAAPALCGCIQNVADVALTVPEQRQAAGFFADPDAAQQVRMSKSAQDGAFWARYRNFGALAERHCSS